MDTHRLEATMSLRSFVLPLAALALLPSCFEISSEDRRASDEEDEDARESDDWDEEEEWAECARFFEVELGSWEDSSGGWVEGYWEAGWHGFGWLSGVWWWDGEVGQVIGSWGPEDADWSAPLEGWLFETERGAVLEGWAWNDDGAALFVTELWELDEDEWLDDMEDENQDEEEDWLDDMEDGEDGLEDRGEILVGEGWWSFGEAWFEGFATDAGDWTAGWWHGEEAGEGAGAWGSWETEPGGWLAGSYWGPDWELPFYGTWHPWETGEYGWEGQLGDWGYVIGWAHGTEGGAWMEGVGYPYGCW